MAGGRGPPATGEALRCALAVLAAASEAAESRKLRREDMANCTGELSEGIGYEREVEFRHEVWWTHTDGLLCPVTGS